MVKNFFAEIHFPLSSGLLLLFFGIGLFLVFTLAYAEEGWNLIHKDDRSNRLYIDTKTLSRSPNDIVKVWMKFISAKSRSPMLFLNEIDCSRNRIKRLAVRIQSAPGVSGKKPEYELSFAGKWDRLSEGLERLLKSSVCSD